MEDLTIYQGNSGNIRATVDSGIDASALANDYTGYIIAKEQVPHGPAILDLSSNSWDSSTALFPYTTSDSSIDGGPYQFEFYVSSSENVHTVGQGTLNIKPSYR